MARPAYPSDERRRKMRPHIKVHLTVASHPKTAELWSDLEMRAMLVELWRIAGEAFAGRTGGAVALSPAAVRSITGRERHHLGLRKLVELCLTMGYEVRTRSAPARTDPSPHIHGVLTDASRLPHGVGTVVVTIRNFSTKQGFDSAVRGATTRTPHPSDSDSDSDSERGKKPRAARPPKFPVSAEGVRALWHEDRWLHRQALKHKSRFADIDRSDVWFFACATWERMAERNHRDLKRTVANWLGHVRDGELDKIRYQAAVGEFDALKPERSDHG